MYIKTIFIFSFFWKIFLNNPNISQLEKFGEIEGSGENYYYLDIEDYEKGDEIYIELLFQDNYFFPSYKDIRLCESFSDYNDYSSFNNLFCSITYTYSIVDNSANYYYIYEVPNKKKYLLLSTSSFASEISPYTIRHFNLTLYELPKYSEKTIKGEKLLFLNVNDYELYEQFILEVSFKNSLFNHKKLPLGFREFDDDGTFNFIYITFNYSSDYQKSSSKYTFTFKVYKNLNTKYLLICTPNLKELSNTDITIKHLDEKNNLWILYIVIPIFTLIIIIIIVIYYKRRKKNIIEEKVSDDEKDTPTPTPQSEEIQKPFNPNNESPEFDPAPVDYQNTRNFWQTND